MVFGAIEGGGTKFVCALGISPENLTIAQFPTSTPELTLGQVLGFFKAQANGQIQAVGVGSFGPLDIDPASPAYGRITSTPKAGWENYNLVGAIADALHVPVALDTDVNVALLGEARWGAARGLRDAVYLTIGTGVGGAVLASGEIVHGLMHPEIGHLHIPHDRTRDPFPGTCPYHGDCLEGLASGPAIQARWNTPAATLALDHPAWDLEAHYLALAALNLTVTLSPRCILLGGGVMQQAHLFPRIRSEFARLLNNYIRRPELLGDLTKYIQPPQLQARAGVAGGLVLAEQALATSNAAGRQV